LSTGAISAWRIWARDASPQLLEAFESKSGGIIKEIRRLYPLDCAPTHPSYLHMRREMIEKLDQLALEIEESHADY